MDSYTVCNVCKKSVPVGGSFILFCVSRQHQEQEGVHAEVCSKLFRFVCENCALKDRFEVSVPDIITDLPTVEEEMASRKDLEEMAIEYEGMAPDDKPTR